MQTLLVPPPLRERLGAAGSDGVVMMFAEAYRIGTEQLDRRLAEVSANSDRNLAEVSASFERHLSQETAKVHLEMATLKFDLLRWNFLFWLGQLAALTAILSAMLNSDR